jgi:hypothetical protein
MHWSALALLSPEAPELPAVGDVFEAGGIALHLLNDADEAVFVETRVVLDAGIAGFFTDLFQCHDSTPCHNIFLQVRSFLRPFISKTRDKNQVKKELIYIISCYDYSNMARGVGIFGRGATHLSALRSVLELTDFSRSEALPP